MRRTKTTAPTRARVGPEPGTRPETMTPMAERRSERLGRPLTGWLLMIVASAMPGSARGESVDAVATFHHVGMELRVDNTVSQDTCIDVSFRRVERDQAYRQAQPLVRIGPGRYAGSVVGVASGTTYEIRLESAALTGGIQTLRVNTRVDAFPPPDGRVLHVSRADGRDTYDGLTAGRPIRSLGAALKRVRPGDTILMSGGRYPEGDLTLPVSGTAEAPIAIRAKRGETPVLDGTDPDFDPEWEALDADAGLYRTPCDKQPTNAYLDGQQLFHYRNLADLRTKRWNQPSGYATDGRYLYVRFPDDGGPKQHRVTIPRYTTGLTIARRAHVHVVGLEFCYYGYGTYHRGIYLDAADDVLVDRCVFHHTGVGVALKRDADFNTIQNCSFTESPVHTWSWHAVKTGGVGYEAGGVGVYTSDMPNKGNVIRHNSFRNMFDASGLYSRSLEGPTTNMDFHGNLIDTCSDDAVETDGAGINNRIYCNTMRRFLTGISVAPCALGPTYIFRNVLLDWRPVGEFGGYPFKFNVGSPLSTRRVFLYHNTCVTTVPGQPGFLFKGYSNWAEVVSRNNIFAGTTTALESWSETNPVDFDYDLLHSTRGTEPIRWARKPYHTIDAFYEATGQEQHGILADPRFRQEAEFPVALRPDSPAVDRGIPIANFNDRYAGDAPDVGALEFPETTHPVPAGPQPNRQEHAKE